jgi:hypothetical protein
MVLRSYVKQCKKCDYIGGGGGRFHNVCDDGQPNGSLPKKISSKHLCFGIHQY